MEVGDRTIETSHDSIPAAPRERPVHVLVRREGEWLQVVVKDSPLVFGRAETADIRLQDGRVSKRHCQVRCVEDDLEVTDLNSTNGTLVDESRVAGSCLLPVGGTLRVGHSLFTHEVRSSRDIQVANEIEAELRKARAYVLALIPAPLTEGMVRTDWAFQPSSILGGDAFGYHDLDADRFAIYLIDVCGHGAGAAMLSVAAISTLRQQSLPGVDFSRPSQVARGLNQVFDMDRHDGMYFTLWYGVYDRQSRVLAYASAGHPPALLVEAGNCSPASLRTPGLAIGTFQEARFREEQTRVEPGSTLYVFSDGVFEVLTRDGTDWTFEDFRRLVVRPRLPGVTEPIRLKSAIEGISGRSQFADDFSLLVVEFP